LVYSRVLWSGCWRLLAHICLWRFIFGPRGIAPRQRIRYTGRYWAWRRIKFLTPCRVFISIASMGMRLRLSSGRTLTPEPTLGSQVWWSQIDVQLNPRSLNSGSTYKVVIS
jgi:hypothetical protein